MTPQNASWLELQSNALRKNIQAFRHLSQGTFRIGVVLKGNAYGHGLKEITPLVQPEVDCIYVIAAQDGLLIREQEKTLGLVPKRVIVIGAVTNEEVLECSLQNIELVLGDEGWRDFIPSLRKAQLKAKAHIHLDTGLSREGFLADRVKTDLEFLKESKDVIEAKGVMSHFANTEDVTEQAYANQQVAAFEKGRKELSSLLSADPKDLESHFAASAATLVLPKAHFNMVRVGISLYGLWPSSETRISAKVVLKDLPQLEPVLSWKCRSQLVKTIQKGSYVGYGCTYRCDKETRIAVLPVGYFDGYPRLASGKANVIVNQTRCPVLGRVMMNHLIVDITQASIDHSPVTATLLGRDGEEQVSAETLAGWAQTIHYELVTRLGSHLKRIVV